MLTVTEAASGFLAELIEVRGFSREIAIRLFYEDRTLAMVGDRERVNDVTFRRECRTVLLLAEHDSGLLADRCLVVDTSAQNLHGNDEEA